MFLFCTRCRGAPILTHLFNNHRKLVFAKMKLLGRARETHQSSGEAVKSYEHPSAAAAASTKFQNFPFQQQINKSSPTDRQEQRFR